MSGGPAPLPSELAPPAGGLRALLAAIRSDGRLDGWLQLHCPQPERRRHPRFVADLVAAVCFDALVSGEYSGRSVGEGGGVRTEVSWFGSGLCRVRSESDVGKVSGSAPSFSF